MVRARLGSDLTNRPDGWAKVYGLLPLAALPWTMTKPHCSNLCRKVRKLEMRSLVCMGPAVGSQKARTLWMTKVRPSGRKEAPVVVVSLSSVGDERTVMRAMGKEDEPMGRPSLTL